MWHFFWKSSKIYEYLLLLICIYSFDDVSLSAVGRTRRLLSYARAREFRATLKQRIMSAAAVILSVMTTTQQQQEEQQAKISYYNHNIRNHQSILPTIPTTTCHISILCINSSHSRTSFFVYLFVISLLCLERRTTEDEFWRDTVGRLTVCWDCHCIRCSYCYSKNRCHARSSSFGCPWWCWWWYTRSYNGYTHSRPGSKWNYEHCE